MITVTLRYEFDSLFQHLDFQISDVFIYQSTSSLSYNQFNIDIHDYSICLLQEYKYFVGIKDKFSFFLLTRKNDNCHFLWNSQGNDYTVDDDDLFDLHFLLKDYFDCDDISSHSSVIDN